MQASSSSDKSGMTKLIKHLSSDDGSKLVRFYFSFADYRKNFRNAQFDTNEWMEFPEFQFDWKMVDLEIP